MATALEIQKTNEMPAPRVETGAAITPMEMLNAAVQRGADIDVLAKLMDLQDRWERSQARKAFDEAIANAKAAISPIVRNATGHNNKRYADFAAIARAVDPIITEHGLSYRFRTTQTDRINVTCVLSHKAGHFEETTLSGPPDASGSKNAIQAIGSTLTYLQRYSLIQALGLSADNDDDGANHGRSADEAATVSDAQASELRDLIETAQLPIEKFCARWRVNSVPEIKAKSFDEVKRSLSARINSLKEKAAQNNG